MVVENNKPSRQLTEDEASEGLSRYHEAGFALLALRSCELRLTSIMNTDVNNEIYELGSCAKGVKILCKERLE